MLRKYFLIGFRTLRRKPTYTFLNVSGLAIGMAVCLLVGLYVHDELQFDRFHQHADRIVQIGHETSFMGRSLVTSYPLKQTLQEHVPAIELATHFKSGSTALQTNPDLYIFGFAALFVLVIAGINYVNLATAQGMKRALEVAIRKTMGTTRGRLAMQFLIESILVGSAALGLSFLLAEAILPLFNHSFGKHLGLFQHGWIVAGLCVFLFLVAIASGAYPAFFLSRFRPVVAMRGQAHTSAAGATY